MMVVAKQSIDVAIFALSGSLFTFFDLATEEHLPELLEACRAA